MTRLLSLVLVLPALLAVWIGVALSQPAPLTLRLALLSQWTADQHRGRAADLQQAIDRGVVDRPVFRWQGGLIQMSSLVWKPVVVLPPPEAAALGGRGAFQLAGVVPPSGSAAWTTVQVVPQTAQPDDVLVLQVGGELNTIRQVLETLLVAPPDGSMQELSLASRAVISGAGVTVARVPFGQPVAPGRDPFRGIPGAGFFVARSLVRTVTNATVTANGAADRAADHTVGDWREGDRLFVRVPLESLRAGAPAVVAAWKDRVDKPDTGDGTDIRPSRLDGVFGR